MSENNKRIKSIKAPSEMYALMRMFMYASCTFGIIISLNAGCNSAFQSFKSRYTSMAFIFFMVMLWALQRIKLLNWQSLVISVPFFVYEGFYITSFLSSPDYYPTLIFSGIAIWMALMIIVDMLLTRRHRHFDSTNRWLFAAFCVVVFCLLINRAGRTIPIAYCAFVLYYLMDIDKEEWKTLLNGIVIGCFASTIFVTILSFVMNPLSQKAVITDGSGFDDAGRWYGYFLNIGDFGQFLGLMMVISLFSILIAKNQVGRKSVRYIVSILWLLLTIVLAVLNATRTLAVGIIFCAIFYFIFGVKKNSPKKMIIKGAIVLTLLIIFFVGGYFILHYLSTMDIEPDKIEELMEEAPYKYFSGFRVLFDRLYKVKTGYSFDPDLISPDRTLGIVDAFSSYRLSIIEKFISNTGWVGQEAPGLQVGDYFAYVAHNQYVQMPYEYGILAGILYVIYTVYMMINSVIRYLKNGRSEYYLLPMLLIAMMLGIWTGEGSTLYFPLTFFVFVLAHRLMVSEKQ